MTAPQRVASRPTWLLGRAHLRAQSLLHAALAEEGLRGYHYRVLAALEENGPASQADLGRATGSDRSDVVTTLDELVSGGLAGRAPHPTDRRRNVVTLTARGRRRLDELDRVLDDVQEAVLAPLTAAERRTLLRLLPKLG